MKDSFVCATETGAAFSVRVYTSNNARGLGARRARIDVDSSRIATGRFGNLDARLVAVPRED
jgi:hypothetical protein